MRVAVTGASGFVGGAVCRELSARGAKVFAYGRRPSVPEERIGRRAEYRSWDITSGVLPEPPRVDVVVHCAGTVTDWGPAAGFFATNLEGTRNVLASFPGTRFVHVSTASVYDPFRPTVRATEDEAPVARYENAYGASKAAAERAVRAASAPTVILRPHAVYGPGDTTLLPRVLSAVRGPLLVAVGTGRQLISLTHVDNLVQACLLAAETDATGTFNITDAAPLVIDDAFAQILAERRIKARRLYLPERALRPLAAAAEGAFLLAGSPHPPRLTRYALSHLAVERTLNLTAAHHHLAYTPTPTTFTGASTW
ncbi:NAD(P)-dependent oxidoreductase [Actinocorallia lasiicapitis]